MFPASLARSYAQMIDHGPGAYCLTRGALYAFLPGLTRPLRMNYADQSMRPCYTLMRDEGGRVEGIVDLIEHDGMAWRWLGGNIARTR